MSTTYTVHMGEAGYKVGTLVFEARGARQHSVFTYDDAWMGRPDGFPIAPTMPFGRKTFFTSKGLGTHASAFPKPIADTCPDAWGQAILNRDKRTKGVSITDIDYLAGVDDIARIGALRFKSPDGSFVRSGQAGRPIVPPLLDIEELMHAADAVESKTETAKDIARLLGNGSSLGGARPKCSVLDENGDLLIAKFTSKTDTLAVERAEVTTLTLAKAVGLDAPEARIMDVAGRAVALIKRFDRGRNGRIPYISAQSMLDREEATGGSYESLAEDIRRHGSEPAANLAELFGRVAFTILVANVDDHLRNHGFIHAGRGLWSLSPLFDVNPSPERDRRLKTTIAEGSGDEASMEILLANARLFGITANRADAVVSSMAETIAQTWRRTAANTGMTAREIASYEPAFVHDQVKVALTRAGTTTPIKPPGKRRGSRSLE